MLTCKLDHKEKGGNSNLRIPHCKVFTCGVFRMA